MQAGRVTQGDLERPAAPAGPRRRRLTSNFLVTVNTNYAPRTTRDAQEVADKLAAIGNDLFLDRRNLAAVFAFRPPYERDTFGRNVFETMLEAGRTEIGPQNGTVHLHLHLRVVHDSKVHLNRYLISQFFLRGFAGDPRVSTIWVNVKGMGDPKNSRDYVNKTLSPADRARIDRLYPSLRRA